MMRLTWIQRGDEANPHLNPGSQGRLQRMLHVFVGRLLGAPKKVLGLTRRDGQVFQEGSVVGAQAGPCCRRQGALAGGGLELGPPWAVLLAFLSFPGLSGEGKYPLSP